jgi:serine phosphatase RsbU (regulator of sigma subunit)
LILKYNWKLLTKKAMIHKKTYITLFLYLTFSFCALFSFSQQDNIDSLKRQLPIVKEDTSKANIYYKLAKDRIRHNENDEAFAYIKLGQECAKKANFLKGQANFYVCLGFIYQHQGFYPRALEANSEALKIYQKLNLDDGAASMYNNIGNVSILQGNYPAALSNYLSALQQFEKTNEKYGIASANGNIGNVYNYQRNYEKALGFYFKSLKMNEEMDDQYSAANNIANIADIYLREKNYQKGFEYAQKCLKIEEELGDKMGAGNTLIDVGDILTGEAQILSNRDSAATLYLQALDYYSKAVQSFKDADYPSGTANAHVSIANTYLSTKRFKLAEDNALQGLQMGKEMNALEIQKEAYRVLSETYKQSNNPAKALDYYKQYILARDSIYSLDKSNEITRSEMNFDFEKKQTAEKSEQEKKDALANEELKQQKFQRNAFIAGFALMMILAIFIFRSFRQKQKANVIIEQQKHEVELQKELVEEKNKEITDSITYAKRLQQAILPPDKYITQYLPENFVLYKPKDIVAGDFYWMEVKNDLILIAAADCTGHGVPGAMVSVVCSNALNRTVKEFGIFEPGKILDKVRELVIETFEKSESEVMDGMDISLCSINKKTGEIKWSGANNPLWYFQDGIQEITANKQPIGKTDKPLPFTTNTIQLNKGEQIYLFTDGYADQFGGEKGKKFKYKQFQEVLLSNKDKSLNEQKKILNDTIEKWKGNLEQVDDILVIGIRL